MNGIVSDETQKRRLPPWMLHVSGVDQVKKSKSGDGDIENIKGGFASECSQTKSKPRTGRHGLIVQAFENDDTEVESSNLVSKSGTKGRLGRNGDVCETRCKKRNQRRVAKTHGIAACRKGKLKPQSLGDESGEDIEVLYTNEDDGDLTVEDLVTIAKECVDEQEAMGQQQSLDEKHKAGDQLSAFSCPVNDNRHSSTTAQINGRSLTDTTTTSCHGSTENLTSELILVNSTKEGDPTQDMLDLFLGPLLKKPHKEQNVANKMTDDMMFAYELRKQNENIVLGEETVPLSKKKTSLKDKVAMFLD